MTKITTAMLLAAGLGTRMKPLTDTLPKPLIEVGGRTLVDRVLDKLVAQGVTRAVVNVHYLAEKMIAHLKTRKDIEIAISDERAVLAGRRRSGVWRVRVCGRCKSPQGSTRRERVAP